MNRQRTAPPITGWITSVEKPTDEHPDGRLHAVRIQTLSKYQAEYGCRTEIYAPTGAELEVLALAELVHASIVSTAEAQAEAIMRAEQAAEEMRAEQLADADA